MKDRRRYLSNNRAAPERPRRWLSCKGCLISELAEPYAMSLAAIAKHISVVDRASKFDLMRSVEFTHTIDYTQTDFTAGQERYDVILDTKTNRPPCKYLPVLNPGGTYVTVGGLTPRLFQVLLFGLVIRWFTRKTVRLVNLQPNQDLAYVNELWAAGQLKPAIEGPYPLSEVPRLIQHFGAGQHQGKIVIVHES